MAPIWTSSSAKHGVSKGDQLYAMTHANYKSIVQGEGLDGGQVYLFIGPPHAQTDREIEILVNVFADGREAIVFHAMALGSKFAQYREDYPA